jgi:hypothetical protein
VREKNTSTLEIKKDQRERILSYREKVKKKKGKRRRLGNILTDCYLKLKL